MWYGMCWRYGTGKKQCMVWYVCGMVWHVLTVRFGKNTVYGMVRLRYGSSMVRCRRCIIWLNLPGGMVCFSI